MSDIAVEVWGFDLGWYVSTQHPGHPHAPVDFVRRDNEMWPEPSSRISGALLALLVQDVDRAHARMAGAGVDVVMALVTEPWGQRRFQVAGPDGLVVEILQPVDPDPGWMADQGLA
jgi:catechol 2,3-dioxygenase-like lactoylglutathione lyase family enzyme